MIFATLKNADGREESCLFYTWDAFHSATFSPDVDPLVVLPLRISGKTYTEQKESARNLAIDVQSADVGGLSYLEVAIIQQFFEKVGKRYGLLSEFRENCVC